MDMFIPPILRTDYLSASKASFEIRKTTHAKTKIRIIKGKIVLFSKSHESKTIEKVDF